MRQRYENIAWQKILFEKLRKKKLEVTLANLAKREDEEWLPFYYKSQKDEHDLCALERRRVAEWQGRLAIELDWGVETRFDAVSLFDDVMRRVRVTERLHVAVAAATLCIAAKLNEEYGKLILAVPVMIANQKMDMAPKDLCRMEALLLRKLHWHPRPCLALVMLQTMMALVAVKVSYCVRGKDFRDEFLNLFLEIQTRWLFILMIQSESAAVRPSVLALSLVYFHLDWDKRSHLKGQLIPWFQRMLAVSSAELDYGLKFSYPLVGFNFYKESSPSSPLSKGEDQPRSVWARGELISDKTTRYDAMQRERVSASDTYFQLRKELTSLPRSSLPSEEEEEEEEEEKEEEEGKREEEEEEKEEEEDTILFDRSSEMSKSRRRRGSKKQRSGCKLSSQPRYVVNRSRRALKRGKKRGGQTWSTKKARGGDADKENEGEKGE